MIVVSCLRHNFQRAVIGRLLIDRHSHFFGALLMCCVATRSRALRTLSYGRSSWHFLPETPPSYFGVNVSIDSIIVANSITPRHSLPPYLGASLQPFVFDICRAIIAQAVVLACEIMHSPTVLCVSGWTSHLLPGPLQHAGEVADLRPQTTVGTVAAIIVRYTPYICIELL